MAKPNSDSHVTVGKFTKNAFYAVGSEVIIRVIGLLSVIITARILKPEDFGLVSIALSSVVIAEVIANVGVKAALVSHPSPTREDYDSAWTIQLIANLLIGIVTAIFVAPAVSNFFQREELTFIIQVLSLRFLFVGLRNIGVVDFERNLAFERDLILRATARLLTFVITIGVALYFRNFWALIVGVIAMSSLWTLFSYLMHSYRPRVCFSLWKYYFKYSRWMLVNAIATSVTNQFERIAIGRIADSHLTGLYATSQDLARICTTAILIAIGRVAMPSLAKHNEDDASFAKHITTAFGAFAFIAAPCGLGISAIADNLILVLMGGQWREAAPLLEYIAIATALNAMVGPFASVLLAKGYVRDLAIANAVFAAILLGVFAVLISQQAGVIAIAQIMIVSHFVWLFAVLVIIMAKFKIAFLGLLTAIGRPCLAAAAMYGIIIFFRGPEVDFPTLELIVDVLIGAASYPALLISIWILSGKPDGVESKIVHEGLQRIKF